MSLGVCAAVHKGPGLVFFLHVFIMDLALFGLEVANLDAPHDLHSRPCRYTIALVQHPVQALPLLC